jgi:hypothetical protein
MEMSLLVAVIILTTHIVGMGEMISVIWINHRQDYRCTAKQVHIPLSEHRLIAKENADPYVNLLQKAQGRNSYSFLPQHPRR